MKLSVCNIQLYIFIDSIPFAVKRMIHWSILYRVSLSHILIHKRYCLGCSSGQKGEPCTRPVNAGLIFALPYIPATSKELQTLHSDFHKTWSIVHVSAAPWYILSYTHGQNIPQWLYKLGHSPFNSASPVTVDTRQFDPWVSYFFVSTDLCFFYPPLNLKPLSFQLPPPFPGFFSHTLFTHIQIKKLAPFSLFY